MFRKLCLRNRGVRDILIACIDNLNGFSEAIETAFPDCSVQLCIVHQCRNPFKYIPYKHYKEFAQDLKAVYRAATEGLALEHLRHLEKKWGGTYPYAVQN